MTRKPLIAITLDIEKPGGYSKFPWYALRENYCDAIFRAGGIPVPVPHYPDLAQNYASLADGFMFTGGGFDIDPELYGAKERHETVQLKHVRTTFEWALLKAAHGQHKPILGICGGMQLLNVVLGGTLIQHIPDEISGGLAHKQPNSPREAGHEIVIAKNTLLARLAQVVGAENRISVNSVHHQAVKKTASPLVMNAMAPDGIIEGIEDPSQPFCLGVQWHPEFDVSPLDKEIFTQFVEASCQ